MRKLITSREVAVDYEAPCIELLSVTAEWGFAGSLTIEDSDVKDYEGEGDF